MDETVASITIHCPQHLNITMVDGFKETLQAALDKGGACKLNVGLVEKVDSTGLQLMIAFRKALVQQGGSVEVKGKSEAFDIALETLGMKHLF
ncbi:lipid asymmetry maintenance protein MlaB [Reinekea sp. G2M2-21]|uniref:STAS domain-containing protein n=1 Tax=Reinekea sp. G2M2-21 TaxID=2788942 RepID=UPI0018AB0C0F|nr:STAS domain-containing protein [Reinekea sp. G2M2-21]